MNYKIIISWLYFEYSLRKIFGVTDMIIWTIRSNSDHCAWQRTACPQPLLLPTQAYLIFLGLQQRLILGISEFCSTVQQEVCAWLAAAAACWSYIFQLTQISKTLYKSTFVYIKEYYVYELYSHIYMYANTYDYSNDFLLLV